MYYDRTNEHIYLEDQQWNTVT